jgi:DNA-binding GntR family transcriptional regulator
VDAHPALLGGSRARHRTMAEVAVEEIREAIIHGELVPGAPLRLEDLARALGMSISPIREAVRRLEALGLAEHVPHHGAKVVALDVDDLRDLFQVRLAIETLAVRRASGCLAALAAARTSGDVRAAMRAHTEFHFTLYAASGSQWLPRLIRPAWDSCERYRPALFLERGELQDRHQQLDAELLAACAAREADAAADALRRHLELAGSFYARELGDRGIFQ